ncbi:MAG: YihA family ribosome biogenesis GTP-binding protein [Clostridia bacterium]|nr:YihA family ribosome biogenesis GTP-binding protein [Clostridia bacterium]
MIKKAVFVTSVGNINQIKTDCQNEIAIAGKSNVGKSSFINFICNNSKLAKTSKEPGRTRLLNYFSINDGEYYLVDLPGYGYAKVNDAEKEKWGRLIETYFKTSPNLKNVFTLVDIRHDPTENDMIMFKYLYFYNIPFTIIATKADKLSRSAQMKRKKEIADFIGVGVDNVLVCSSKEKKGGEEIFKRIDQILNN